MGDGAVLCPHCSNNSQIKYLRSETCLKTIRKANDAFYVQQDIVFLKAQRVAIVLPFGAF